MKILIDMDGVVADFVGGILNRLGKKSPYTDASKLGDKGWDIVKLLEIEPSVFWDACDANFWLTLDKTPEADRIIEECYNHSDELCFLTSPCRTPGCMDAKVAWADWHFPGIPILLSRAVKGGLPPKSFVASPLNYLIDDNSDNVDSFVNSGGQAFLLPRPWNRCHESQTDIVGQLAHSLSCALKR